MSNPLANQLPSVRVFVQWTESTVFAGEDIECQITFKNVATVPAPSRTSLHPSSANGIIRGAQRNTPSTQIKSTSPLGPRNSHAIKGHKTTLSLNVPVDSLRSQPSNGSWSGHSPKAAKGEFPHKRSVSIVSIGTSDAGNYEDFGGRSSFAERPRVPSRGHGRSASLQIIPRRHGVHGGPISAPIAQRSSTQPSPKFSFPLGDNASDASSRRRAGVATAPSTPSISGVPFARRKGSGSFPQNFKFPAPTHIIDTRSVSQLEHGSKTLQDSEVRNSPNSRDTRDTSFRRMTPVTRVLSPASVAGTPRSSGEFYSLSNNSTETLVSEYVPQQSTRLPSYGAGAHARRSSNLLPPVNHQRPPETLMMGYAQVQGSFMLDGSLINQSPFEEIKRKGAVGGQGGGVVGIETNKRDSGFLRGFGWGNLGESLGGLLGGGELSSMKEMRSIASSRSIPLLSTPQSILFVDLQLAPGESRSYKYSFKLPRGLPPSYRGKAIKISYKLVVGTQRPGGAKEQQVKSVEVPFRILGSVNNHGELLGHDLLSPYVILRDLARVKVVERLHPSWDPPHPLATKTSSEPCESSLDEFLGYVNDLLTRPRQNSSLGLLSPTEAPRSRRQSSTEEPTTAKEAIDMAILRSNVATDLHQSANKFEIARSGQRIAVIMLARPAYRLGETITAAVDFTDAQIPCYAVHVALETSERVDSSIALRSEASILRVTRKVHFTQSESTLFARRIVFSPTIPASATPEFITSGVSLDWRIRIEFVTHPLSSDVNNAAPSTTELLEEISKDDRGIVLAASEMLDCESFEVAVPLRVYGAVTGNTEKDDSPSGGLVV